MSKLNKYKLIQRYPSLPDWIEEGMIASQSTDSNSDVYAVAQFETKPYNARVFTAEEIENHPDYWEKVIERDYEIQSFRRTNGDRDIFTILSDGTYWWKNESYIGEGMSLQSMLNVGACVENGDFEILSVKRLSDGEVFTLGDETNKGVIKSFEHYDEVCHCKVFSGLDVYNGDINKLKHPIFTTEDDVNIYEGDEYWYVPNSFDCIGHVYDAYKNVTQSKNKTYFSTREKAEKYLKDNRASYEILSIKEKDGDNRVLKVKDFKLNGIDSGAYLESYEGAGTFNKRKDEIDYILENFDIYSVKRTPDGEVFTVGDTVEFFHGVSKITGFVIDDLWMGDMVVNGERENESIAIASVYHVKPEPIFTTEDGVNIYEGDVFYEVADDGVHRVEWEGSTTEELYESFLELKEVDGRKAFGLRKNAYSHYYHIKKGDEDKLKFTGSEIVEVLSYFGISNHSIENILEELVIRKR